MSELPAGTNLKCDRRTHKELREEVERLTADLVTAQEDREKLGRENVRLRAVYEMAKAYIQARGPEAVSDAVSGIGLNDAMQSLRESIMRYEMALAAQEEKND